MWFKQAKIYNLTPAISYDGDQLASQLEPLTFTPCLPSFPSSQGWITPFEEEATLVRAINGFLLICLQIEEKILPATVVRQELNEKIKHIEARRDKKVSHKEKYALKDEVIRTLLPRAFSKLSRVYGYIDTKNNWLVIDTTNTARVETFLDFFKRSLSSSQAQNISTIKVAPVLTSWLTHQTYPDGINVEKSCVLADPNRQSRVIRCQEQDLFATSAQTLIKDNFEVKQLALSWQDRINFVLADDFSLRNIKFQEQVIAAANDMEPETKQQQFDADFLIMTGMLSGLLAELLQLFAEKQANLPEAAVA